MQVSNETIQEVADFLKAKLGDVPYMLVSATGPMKDEETTTFGIYENINDVDSVTFLLGTMMFKLHKQGLSFVEAVKLTALSLKTMMAMHLDMSDIPSFMGSYDIDIEKLMSDINYDPKGERLYLFIGEGDTGDDGKCPLMIKVWGSYASCITMAGHLFAFMLNKYEVKAEELLEDLALSIKKAENSMIINLGD